VRFLALDLGAESGRGMVGTFDGQVLRLGELHRFGNSPVRLPGGLHWDVLRLWSECQHSLAVAAGEHGQSLTSVGIDTWGVDFGLVDREGTLLGNPYHYRDGRTDGMLEEAFRRMPRAEIFEHTGIQFLQINSLYQLLSMVIRDSPALRAAEGFLTMPDLLNYWLTGRRVGELTIGSTTQCFNPRANSWDGELLERLGIPAHIFPPVVPPGTELGHLLPHVAQATGAPASLPVIAPACHDTGSAVAAVPAQGADFAWISSGTWSVVGAEVREPVIDARSLRYNFTNEGGVCGTFRFCRNVMGLWLVQECRRTWAQQGQERSYGELAEMAAAAQPLKAVIDPDDGEFLKPGDIPARIRAFCQRTAQAVPETQGEIVRCALEGIALKYRWVLERAEEMLGRRLAPLHIVGGGTQNRLLSQLTADATGRMVIAGPVEATAAGNVLIQMIALGHAASLSEAREVMHRSCELETFEPRPRGAWGAAYERLLSFLVA
jgi:rhamnulokinase